MKAALLHAAMVGSGGFAGALLRYWLSTWVNRQLGSGFMPFGTLIVNLLGCVLIGLVAGVADRQELLGLEARLLLVVGLLGGFTTFSAFALESLLLLQEGNLIAAVTYVGAHLILGVALVWLAYMWMTGG